MGWFFSNFFFRYIYFYIYNGKKPNKYKNKTKQNKKPNILNWVYSSICIWVVQKNCANGIRTRAYQRWEPVCFCVLRSNHSVTSRRPLYKSVLDTGCIYGHWGFFIVWFVQKFFLSALFVPFDQKPNFFRNDLGILAQDKIQYGGLYR